VVEYLWVFRHVGFFCCPWRKLESAESLQVHTHGGEQMHRTMSRDAADLIEILLIEDSLENASVMIQALKRGNVQCRVSLVCDDEEAISFLHRKGEFAQAPTPDLILLSTQLPRKEGWHVLAEIQVNEELKGIPVAVLTCSSVHRASLQIQELHVDGFMTEPVELDKFLGVVKSRRRSWLAELVLSSTA
jgi:CheY-like chemotaxis protein